MERKLIYISILALIGTAIFSFIFGVSVGAMRNEYRIIEYRQGLKEAEQKMADYKSELSHLRNQSSKDYSNNLKTIDKMNWSEAVK
jgi:hypothetical protein